MGIEFLLMIGMFCIGFTVLILSFLLILEKYKASQKKKRYHNLIRGKMQILEQIHKDIFTQEPLLSKVFQPDFGYKAEVQL